MNRKNILGAFMIILMVSSGPLYIPLALATSQQIGSVDETEKTLDEDSSIENPFHANVFADADIVEGHSPLFVSFIGTAYNSSYNGGVLFYAWDFDGDGYDDYVNLDTGNTTHVYTVDIETKYNARFTVKFNDDSTFSDIVSITVLPIDQEEWYEIKNMGFTYTGIRKNGEVIVFDESDWINLYFNTDEEIIESTYYTLDNYTRLLIIDTQSERLNISITYGLTGRVQLKFVKFNEIDQITSLSPKFTVTSKEDLTSRGRLDYKIKPIIDKEGNRQLLVEAGNHDPWTDQGITPYGEYFFNLNEYVSMYTGFLNIIQKDYAVPGRGLDLNIKRVYAQPATYENNVPATSFDYSYQDYPWAPMGNGWQLGFPWIETDDGEPSYIRYPNGQRYKYEGAGLEGTEYKTGDYFKLYNHTNGNYTLYMIDGTRYSFDSTYRLMKITDTTGINHITFTYQNNKIYTITDTINRAYTFNYNGNGYLSSITCGDYETDYYYTRGVNAGYKLVKVKDNLGRLTYFDYISDYRIGRIRYPSGGASVYTYQEYADGSYRRYRVDDNWINDGYNETRKDYSYTATFQSVTGTTINEYDAEGQYRKKTSTTFTTQSYTETIYDETEAETQVQKHIKYYTDNKRVEGQYRYYDSTHHVDDVKRFDNWGNTVYHRDYEGQKTYYSYSNTNNSTMFVSSSGQQIHFFSDSFYSNIIDEDIHDLLIGRAEYQNGVDSSEIESYWKYSENGLTMEYKTLSDEGWIKEKYYRDIYGNLIKKIDPVNNTEYYDYGDTYNHAYVTSRKSLLKKGIGQNENITTYYDYDYLTGKIIRVTDPKQNITKYRYDEVNRLINITHPTVDSISAYRMYEYNDSGSYPISSGLTKVSDVDKYSWWYRTQTFSAEGRRWVFFNNGNYIYYTSSSDGGFTWRVLNSLYSNSLEWDLYFDGAYVHAVYSKGDKGNPIYYRRGNPNSDGTIAWDTVKGVGYPGSERRFDCPQIITTANYVWVGVSRWNEAFDNDLIIYQSSNMDGGWTQVQSTVIKTDQLYPIKHKFAKLNNDRLYLVYETEDYDSELVGKLWNGVQWLSEEIIDNRDDSAFDVSYWGNDVYVIYTNSSSLVNIVKRSLDGTWSSPINISYLDEMSHSVCLTRGEVNGTLFAIYVKDGVSYRYFNGLNWCEEKPFSQSILTPDYANSLTASTDIHDDELSIIHTYGSPMKLMQDYLSTKPRNDNSIKGYDENSNLKISYYNGLGKLVKTERYNGSSLYSSETYKYNYLGQISSWRDAELREHCYEYDVLGSMIKKTNPDETFSVTNYNHMLNEEEVIDEEGRKKILYYDWLNRIEKIREYNSTSEYYETKYIYDKVGNLVTYIDSLNRITYYYYDRQNRLIETCYPDHSYELFTYDAAGNMILKRSASGNYTTYYYDSLNRLVNVTYNDRVEPVWLSGWTYRKEVWLGNENNKYLRDYQIKFKVHRNTGTDSPPDVFLGAKCRADFGDIRFTNMEGNQLSYWIQSVDDDTATIWVKVDKIVYPQDTLIYIYYGNPEATTTSSGASTWIHYEDWESYWDGATLPLGIFSSNYNYNIIAVDDDTYVYEGDYSLFSDDPSSIYTNGIVWDFNDKNSGGYRFIVSVYVDSSRASSTYWNMIWINSAEEYTIHIFHEHPDSLMYYHGGDKDSGFDVELDEWNTLEICAEIGTSKYSMGVDGSDLSSFYYRETLVNFRYCQMAAATLWDKFLGNFDVFVVGNYDQPEPIIELFGSEEENSTVLGRRTSACFSHDANGNLIRSEYNRTIIKRRFDSRNRLICETFNVSGAVTNVEYRYDNASNVVELGYPDSSSISMVYDGLNRLTHVEGVASISYTYSDKIDSITYGNCVTTNYLYDERDRPVNIVTTYGLTVLQNLTYSYDDSGSVTSVYNGTHTETYSYDLLDRLTGSLGPWGSLNYTYDSVGNRLCLNRVGSVTSYTYDSVNRIASATGMAFTWDDDGNLLTWDDGVDDWTYRYDSEDRLINVKKNGAFSAHYTYDADGRRVRSVDGGGVTDYVYSGLNVIDEVCGGVHEKHVYAGGIHVASNSSGAVEYYHVDHLGSTRLKTNSTGSVIYESNYEPYGPGLDETGSEDYRYTGKREDPTGLYYYGARYYDPVTGRFTTRDTVFGDLTDPQSLNRYSYCRNNPQKYVDPDGKFAIQLGYGGSAGLLITGFCVSQGIAISIDWSGIGIGTYTEIGTGAYFGGGAGIAPKAIVTPSAKSINDLEGESFSIQGSVATPFYKGGIGASAPIEGTNIDLSKPSYSFDLPIPMFSFGAKAKISAHVTKTIVNKKWVINFNSLFLFIKQETNPVNIPNEAFFTNSQSVSEWNAYDIYEESKNEYLW